jgi:hypothetical protein
VEYAALFVWIALCLLLGGLMHFVTAGALAHRPVQLLAAPGMVVRKFTMTLVALVSGATVTRVRVYELSSRDIDFRADGFAGIAKVLVPLAPLFGGAMAVVAVNDVFGSPLRLDCRVPALASFDAGGLRGFLDGTWGLLSVTVRQGIRADWHNPRLYVLFGLLFSLALGASCPFERMREALLGTGLVCIVLALLSSIAVRRAQVVATSPAWFVAARDYVVGTAGIAFFMMVYGMLTALVVVVAVRVYEIVTGAGARSRPRSTSRAPAAKDELPRAA